MTKTDEGMTYTTKIIFLLILAILVVFLLNSGKPPKSTLLDPSNTVEITNPSDLDQAQDELNTVNVDGLDPGLNQLKSEVLTF